MPNPNPNLNLKNQVLTLKSVCQPKCRHFLKKRKSSYFPNKMHICSVTQNTCSVHTCKGCAGVQRRLLKMMSQSLVCLNRGFPQRETGHICPADIHISVDKIKYAAARWKEGHMPFSLSHFSSWDTPASHAHALARVRARGHPPLVWPCAYTYTQIRWPCMTCFHLK